MPAMRMDYLCIYYVFLHFRGEFICSDMGVLNITSKSQTVPDKVNRLTDGWAESTGIIENQSYPPSRKPDMSQ